MFFRRGEKLLLACLVGILVFAMSGCGIIGKFYETSTIEDFLNKNNPKDETEYTDVIDGDTSMSIIIQGNTDSEENSYVIELTDAMYEKVGFEYIVISGAEIYAEPGINNDIIGTVYGGDRIYVLYQVEADGQLWGRIDAGWVRMVQIACSHHGSVEAPDQQVVDNILTSAECWTEAYVDYNVDNGLGVGNLSVSGYWHFYNDGSFVFNGSTEIYGIDPFTYEFTYLGSEDRGTQDKEGYFSLEDDHLILNYTYIEWEDSLDYPVTEVMELEFYDDLIVINDEFGNRHYVYSQDLYTIWERNHSGS